MADLSVKRPIGILYDVILKVANFIFFVDFVILGCKVGFEVLIILCRLFLETKRFVVIMERNKVNFRLNDEEFSLIFTNI